MPRMKIDDKQITLLLQSSERLHNVALPQTIVNDLINYAALIAFRQRLGKKRPKLIGFIGCTGTGKSTLFNSITEKRVSITGWKAHNTRGPILFSTPDFQTTIQQLENELGSLLLPKFDRQYLTNPQESTTLGATDKLHWLLTDNHKLSDLVLIDLPDINTTKSRADRLIALEVLPWLDQVIYVVDEESLYHRDYIEAVEISKSLQQSRLAVINNRGKDRIVLDHPDFQESQKFFGVNNLHVLPIIQSGPVFTNEPEFIDFKKDLHEHFYAPAEPVFEQLTPLAQDLIRENQWRNKAFKSLETELNQRILDLLSQQKPIGFDKILHDDVLNVLQHLGLKRFAISNIIRLFKNISSTGSLQRSFNLAFGNKRGNILDHLLNVDENKLKEEVSNRLQDLEEEIWAIIRRNPNQAPLLELAPELRRISLTLDDDLSQKLNKATENFEIRCRELLKSDTVSSSIKNDPLVALGLIVAFVVDIFTIPSFGSWILAPSVLKYLPLGQFEQIKKDFQRDVQNLIQRQVRQHLQTVQDIHSHYSLRDSEPAFQALKSCAS